MEPNAMPRQNILSRTVPRRVALHMLLLLAMLGGCRSGAQISDVDLETIGYERFGELRQAGEKEHVVVIDVRATTGYRQGHIPGAIHIPLPELQRNDPRLAAATRLIVYGAGWDSPLSPAAGKKLIALGYNGVYDYRGGVEDWRSQGGRLVTEEGVER